ncbi:haloacid dehalogenase [Citricoccus zhacaiensis]|uniref:haloacid dehalogenase n=1 Tax=Citricoccus zhacaiensis TaxID=489142 RepID=UPI001667B367|nr:haloacid dehalogenase [Citricoccus zhacaiensis]
MRTVPPFGLLLDVDGPIASPETRRVPDGIVTALVSLAGRGIPVVFNTGRSADFVLQHVAAPLLAAGLPGDARFHAVCEKGAVHFSFAALADLAAPASGSARKGETGEYGQDPTDTDRDAGLPRATRGHGVPVWMEVDAGMRLPADLESRLVRLVGDYTDTMFYDDTKLAMFSAEMNVGESPERYRAGQRDFEDRVAGLLAEDRAADAFQLDSTIISSDVEHASSGKDRGAERSWALIAADGELPMRWFTCGDSRTDYAMADWLQERGAPVVHVDVRHEDGIPETPYPVMTSDDLAAQGFGTAEGRHEEAGQAFLEWALKTTGAPNATM